MVFTYAGAITPQPTSATRNSGGGAGLDQSGLVGDDDGLDAVAQAELLEDPRDVRLDRRLAEEELPRDLGVRAAAGEQAQDVDLARRQLGQLGREPVAHRRPPRVLLDHALRD